MNDPTFAIAFGAGGARGLAHIHAVAALEDLGIKPAALAGSSMGAVVSVALAAGLSANDMKEMVLDRFDRRLDILAHLWRMRPTSVSELLSDGGPRIGELNGEKLMDGLLPDSIPERIEELVIPTSLLATDYNAQGPMCFTSGVLRQILAASACIPAIFRAREIDGRFYIDGGISNPVPVDVLAGTADYIIGIDVAGGPDREPNNHPGKIETLYAASQIMQRNIAEARAAATQCDLLSRPDLPNIRVLDFHKTREILELSAPYRDSFKREIECVMASSSR